MGKTVTTVSYDDKLDLQIMAHTKKDGHNSRSAIIRKAINFFLESNKKDIG